MTDTGATTVQRFFDLAATGRPRPAIDLALDLVGDGYTVEQVVLDVLVPVQRLVGERWETNQWTTAQEHAATAVVDGVLGAVALQIRPPSRPRGSVLAVCVEEEQHTVPARMGTERLRALGWDVTFLGGSLPAQDLQSFAARANVDVVVLSCTVPLFLPGAARCLAVLADIQLPTVVAGAGFGETVDRASRLGASGWIGPRSDPNQVLSGGLGPPSPSRLADAEARPLEIAAPDVVAACMAELSDRVPALAGYTDAQLAHTETDLGYIVRYLGLAVEFEEPELFDGFASWLSRVLVSRGVPQPVLEGSLEIVAGVLETFGFQGTAAICARATSADRR